MRVSLSFHSINQVELDGGVGRVNASKDLNPPQVSQYDETRISFPALSRPK